MIICPHCQNEHEPTEIADEAYDENTFEMECAECSKKFSVMPSATWSWSTEAHCELMDEEHEWITETEDDPILNDLLGKVETIAGSECIYCLCKKCGQTSWEPTSEITPQQ